MSDLDGTKYHAWVATAETGEPVCLGGRDGGYSITAYPDDEGRFVGVLISSDEGEIVEALGVIPAVILKDELKLAKEYYEGE